MQSDPGAMVIDHCMVSPAKLYGLLSRRQFGVALTDVETASNNAQVKLLSFHMLIDDIDQPILSRGMMTRTDE
jgi:hypothetical protein